MSNKKEKFVNGVFSEIEGTLLKTSGYDVFLNSGPAEVSPDLDKLTTLYRTIATKWKTQFTTVANLEELILQMRCKENINDIKLSIVRKEYIYARAPFYRMESSTKDLRVIVGKIEFDGDDLNRLAKDMKFMEKAQRKLTVAMDKVISENKIKFNALMSTVNK